MLPSVGHRDPDGRVRHERLRVFHRPAADRRVADVPDADAADEAIHVLLTEDVADEPLALLQVKALVERRDPGGVLTAMLQRKEPVIERWDGVTVGPDDPDESAHVPTPGEVPASPSPEAGAKAFHHGGSLATPRVAGKR
jgi:hypothetical protein